MMNPIKKAWQNWRGTKGEEPTPLIVAETRRSYLWLAFLLLWHIPFAFILVAWDPLELTIDGWLTYAFIMYICSIPYPVYRVFKDTVYTKTDQVTSKLDRTTMADDKVLTTITVGLNPKEEVTSENPTSFMTSYNVHQYGGFREFGVKGDPEDGFLIIPDGSLLDLGHTKVIIANPHRYLVGSLPEPFGTNVKNALPVKDFHFVDLAWQKAFLTIKPEDTKDMMQAMEDFWQLMTKFKNHIQSNGDQFRDEFEEAKDKMLFLKKTLLNADMGKPMFNADYKIKELTDERKKLRSEITRLWLEKQAEKSPGESPPYKEET